MLHHRFIDSRLCFSAHNSWSEMVVIYFHPPGFALSSSSQSLTVALSLSFFFLFFLHGGNNQHLFDAGRCLCDYCEYPLFAFPPCQVTTLLSLLGLAKLALALFSLGVLTFSSPCRKKLVAKETKPKYVPRRQNVEEGWGGGCWWSSHHEEIQIGFPFLSYWYTSILMQ